MSDTSIVVVLPGKFVSYLSGSGLMQQAGTDPSYSYDGTAAGDAAAVQCRQAIEQGVVRRSGSGTSRRVTLDRAGAEIVADYADACLVANSDEPDAAEVRAARTVLARLAAHDVTPV